MAVVVVSTGGTIASTDSTGGDATPELTGSDLLDAIPGSDAVTELRTHDFSTVPSPHFTVEQMLALSNLCEEYAAASDVDGVVITHGTDILEETAYFLDLTYGGDVPVVLTGAMRNPSLPSPDGPGNLLSSVRTAASEDAGGRGVLVCFNDRVHAPRDVTKTNSMTLDTFQSPEFGPLATIDEDRIVWHRTLSDGRPTLDISAETLSKDVHAVTITADMPPAQIECATSAAGLCLATTGAGHIPPTIIPALETLRDESIPMVATTRCPEGRLARATYGFRGSEMTLQDLGMYYSSVNLQKTRIATIVGLAADALDDVFEHSAD